MNLIIVTKEVMELFSRYGIEEVVTAENYRIEGQNGPVLEVGPQVNQKTFKVEELNLNCNQFLIKQSEVYCKDGIRLKQPIKTFFDGAVPHKGKYNLAVSYGDVARYEGIKGGDKVREQHFNVLLLKTIAETITE